MVLKKIEWSWEYGKVYYKIFHEQYEESFSSPKPPPTKPSHDISHFICGFIPNMEWNFKIMPNDIAEYNAVYIENILNLFSVHYYNNKDFDIREHCEHVRNHMKWFSDDYYRIKVFHPSKKTSIDLEADFFEQVDFKIVCKFFRSYYKVWILEKHLDPSNIKISITMDNGVDYEFDLLYDYLNKFKELVSESNGKVYC
jgi:hypothetical protein